MSSVAGMRTCSWLLVGVVDTEWCDDDSTSRVGVSPELQNLGFRWTTPTGARTADHTHRLVAGPLRLFGR